MRRGCRGLLIGVLGVTVGVAATAWAGGKVKCAPDAVQVGPACVDKYEASVWEVPPANIGLINQIKKGTVILADLTAGATQRGVAGDDYGAGCPDIGNGCKDFYAVSIPGVTPSRFLTWFQAAAAARNSDKRLPSNQEWQAAALGTPDGAPCIVIAGGPGLTGTAGCVSDVGAFDMVGNLWEWVADWVPLGPNCPAFGGGFSDDLTCGATAGSGEGPGALFRGGFINDTSAGVFAGYGSFTPSASSTFIGFRAAR